MTPPKWKFGVSGSLKIIKSYMSDGGQWPYPALIRLIQAGFSILQANWGPNLGRLIANTGLNQALEDWVGLDTWTPGLTSC